MRSLQDQFYCAVLAESRQEMELRLLSSIDGHKVRIRIEVGASDSGERIEAGGRA